MPFLSEELCGWIREHLETLGVDEIAIFAMEEGADGDGRRVMVATEMGLADYRYGPRASTARFAIVGRFYAWQAVRGVDLRVETSRLWALEHQTRWWLNIVHPAFRAATEDPQLGRALADFAKVALLMAEPAGTATEEPPPRRPEPKPGSQPQASSSGDRPPARPLPPPPPRPTVDRPSAVAALGLDEREAVPHEPSKPQNGSGSDVQPVGPGATQSASRPQS